MIILIVQQKKDKFRRNGFITLEILLYILAAVTFFCLISPIFIEFQNKTSKMIEKYSTESIIKLEEAVKKV